MSIQRGVPDDGTWSSDSSSSDYPLDESVTRLPHSSTPPDTNEHPDRISSDDKGNVDDGLRDDAVDDYYPEQDN